MKILKVKWDSHPILGNLELDFTDDAGQPFDNILFAGENGTGKTTILESISTFLNLGTFDYFEYIEYVINGERHIARPQSNPQQRALGFHRIENSAGIQEAVYNNIDHVKSNNTDIRHYGCVSSKARADFNTKKITSVTTEVLDKEKHDADKKDDFTSLKQLIVDVQSQDDTLYKQTNIERERLAQELMSPSQFEPISNMYRFTKAFNTFFDNKVKYFGVNDGDGEKLILFSKNGNNIPVDKLSTGEKQIVFRGAYLLKNSRNLNGGIIMVDEPELSMHPKWQKNILQYYKDLFTGTSGQNSQIFFATHSDHVLREALSDRVNNLVIVLTDDSGVTTPKRIDAPAVLPSITSAETNYLAFDIASNDYHIELYGWLQENQGFTSVKECDNYIAAHSSYITALHHKPTRGKGSTTYDTLPTAIRNSIHHPRTATPFSHEELGISVKLLFDILQSSTLTP